jgi:hypothetical protein
LKQVVAQRVAMGKQEFEEEPVFARVDNKEVHDVCNEAVDYICLPGKLRCVVLDGIWCCALVLYFLLHTSASTLCLN